MSEPNVAESSSFRYVPAGKKLRTAGRRGLPVERVSGCDGMRGCEISYQCHSVLATCHFKKMWNFAKFHIGKLQFSNSLAANTLLQNAAYRFAIAENNKLSRVLDRLISTSLQFTQENSAPDIAFNVTQLPPDHASIARSFRAKDFSHPGFRRYRAIIPHGRYFIRFD
ncbi:MAG: hypothetical protein AAFN80_05295 [Pseudomonadota bacterium]